MSSCNSSSATSPRGTLTVNGAGTCQSGGCRRSADSRLVPAQRRIGQCNRGPTGHHRCSREHHRPNTGLGEHQAVGRARKTRFRRRGLNEPVQTLVDRRTVPDLTAHLAAARGQLRGVGMRNDNHQALDGDRSSQDRRAEETQNVASQGQGDHHEQRLTWTHHQTNRSARCISGVRRRLAHERLDTGASSKARGMRRGPDGRNPAVGAGLASPESFPSAIQMCPMMVRSDVKDVDIGRGRSTSRD